MRLIPCWIRSPADLTLVIPVWVERSTINSHRRMTCRATHSFHDIASFPMARTISPLAVNALTASRCRRGKMQCSVDIKYRGTCLPRVEQALHLSGPALITAARSFLEILRVASSTRSAILVGHHSDPASLEIHTPELQGINCLIPLPSRCRQPGLTSLTTPTLLSETLSW